MESEDGDANCRSTYTVLKPDHIVSSRIAYAQKEGAWTMLFCVVPITVS